MVYKGYYDLGPKTMNDMFALYAPERELRSGEELQIVVPKTCTCFGQKNITYRGSIYWNGLPVTIKCSTSPEMFKKALKEYAGFG